MVSDIPEYVFLLKSSPSGHSILPTDVTARVIHLILSDLLTNCEASNAIDSVMHIHKQ